MRSYILFLSFMSSLLVPSQELANTTWKIYDDGELDRYAQFEIDFLSFSDTGSDFLPVAFLEFDQDLIQITDLSTLSGCSGHVGSYTYEIIDSYLYFEVVEDFCAERALYFTERQWEQCPLGLGTSSAEVSIQVYPNPIVATVFIQIQAVGDVSSVQVHDIKGREIVTEDVNIGTTQLNATDWASGVYIVSVISGVDVYQQRLIKL